MPYWFFQWNDEIIKYLAMHGVTPEEFEFVVMHPMKLEKSRTTGRDIAKGQTQQGDFIACVYEWLDKDTILPITAFRPTKGD